ncbi:MAG: 30S ribosomal protein S3 [Candidatus Omnitrophica bacterium]|nr:30S ribosomal protein S3 [Candidatus Omnitrophota bacterium]
MGQKVNPISFRLGYNKDWASRWYAQKEYANFLHEDIKIRNFIKKRLHVAGVSFIEIERAGERARIKIHTARPGIIIGRGGSEIDRLRDDLQVMTGKEIFVDIIEIKKPQMDAQLIAENIAQQLEKRVSFRRAMKKAIQACMTSGAGGIKVLVSGRLGGAEMARKQGYREGKIPLHTLKADIDYGFTESRTTYGIIGVKIWVYKGEKIPKKGLKVLEQGKR